MCILSAPLETILTDKKYSDVFQRNKLLLSKLEQSGIISKPLTPVRDNRIIFPNQAHMSSSKTINDLFKNFKGDYTPSEIDWGKAEGAEI